MNRTENNERGNPISRAFSRFFERGKVGRDKDDGIVHARGDTPRPAAQATPTRTAGTPGYAGTAAVTPQPTAQGGVTTTAARAATATPTVTPTATQQTHTVEKGDTLSEISQKYYGRADRWNVIFQANRDRIDDPDRIFPGQVLVIPDKSTMH